MPRHPAANLLLCLASATLLSAAPAPSSGDLLDRPDAKWRQGPVRYLLTKDEDAQFRKLKSDDERKTFIEQFWAKRDPSPGTPANEFKDMYARRLAVVEEKFVAPEGRGWDEDRGKVVLLLGAPDTIEVKQLAGGGGGGEGAPPGDTAGESPRKKITFTYEREVVPGAPVPLKLEFVQEVGGGYHLLTKFESFSHPRLTGLEPLPVAAPAPAAAAAPPPAEAGQTPPAPAPPAPPTPQQALMDEVLSGPTPTVKLPLAVRVDCFKTSEGNSLATLTLAVKKPASGDPPLLAARIQKSEEEVVQKLERDNSFAPSPDNASAGEGADLVFQAAREVAPGKYSLVAAAKDAASGDVGFVLQSIEVPDFHQQDLLQLSSVTLARKISRLEAPAEPGARFVLGNLRIVPAARGQFRAGEDVCLYFQIYNTANDPASGQPKLKVSYRWEKVEKAGNRIIGGRPIEQSSNSAVGSYCVQVLPVWPGGDYQVVVKVDDLTSKTSAGTTVPFSVVK